MQNLVVREKLNNFFADYPKLKYGRGHVVIPAYSLPAGVYLVKKGHVKQYILNTEGRELVVNIYKKGSFFPMVWAMTETINKYFFEVIDEAEVNRAPKDKMVQFLKREPAVMFDLLERLYTGIDGLLEQTAQNVMGSSKQKVVASLLLMGRRFGEQRGNKIMLKRYFSHKVWGQMSGTSREEVTRILADLRKIKMIDIDHKQLSLVDVNGLEKVLAEV
jgi:CRP/FNR family transcriptional regulator